MTQRNKSKSSKNDMLNSNDKKFNELPKSLINSVEISDVNEFKTPSKLIDYVKNSITPDLNIKFLEPSVRAFDYLNFSNDYSDIKNSFDKASLNYEFLNNITDFYERINSLKAELKNETERAKTLEKNSEEFLNSLEKLKDINKNLKDYISCSNIVNRINPKVEKVLLNSNQKLLHKFNHLNKCCAVVISIDIRRSTELMLKANSSEKFAEFITSLSDKLSICIKENYGVFDKFTGDGILAFFPDFFSGKDSILFALNAAQVCHKIFEQHYNEFEDSFDVFLENIGLGIGIDYGEVSIVNTKAELTVVGKPVVYACRFSSAKAGETLMGQNAKKLIDEKFYQEVNYEKSTIFIKNEGDARCFKLMRLKFDIEEPEYSQYLESDVIFDNNVSKENLNV